MNETADGVAVKGAFVGRESELSVLVQALDEAREARPQIVWVEGEPGIGKTAFLRRFLATVADVAVLEASGEESERTLDYGVVQQLIARATADPDWRALEEEVGRHSPAGPLAVGADLLGILGPLQDDAPAVIVIDDAHWLDSSSANALLFVLRRLHGDRMLVLIGSRPDGIDHLGPGWSRLLSDPDRVRRVRLSGLTGPEISRLADSLGVGPLTLAAVERLREHTAGHPLYVRALLSELPSDRLNFPSGELPAPRSYSATVIARMTEIGPGAQNLVAAAAVGGLRCQLAIAAAVAGVDDSLLALEQAIEADLLVLAPARPVDEIAFSHPLVRAAVYDDLSPTRRRALHISWAERLSGSDALAHRVAASGGADDELALELQRLGEAEISDSRVTAGVEKLLWAARIAGSQELREQSLLRAVEYQVIAGDVPAANSRLDAVMACTDSPRRSATIALLTAAEGRLAEAEAAFRQVMQRPDYGDDPELDGPVTTAIGLLCAFLSRSDEAIEWSQRALKLPGLATMDWATARQALAVGLVMNGHGDEAIAQLADVSPSRIEPEPFEPQLLTARGSVKVWWGDVAGADEDLTTVIRWSRAGATFRNLPNAYAGLAEIEYRLGRWNDGLTHADLAVSLGEDAYRAWELPYFHAVAGYLNAVRANWAAATEHVEAARRTAQATPIPMCLYHACSAAAQLAWVRGEWDAVLKALEPFLGLLSGAGAAIGLGRRTMQSTAAEALLFTGRVQEADELLSLMASSIDDRLADPTRIELWRLRGLLEQERRELDRARSAFERGNQVAGTFEAPLARALLEVAQGQFLRKHGSRRAAIATLLAARDRLSELGAPTFLARCEAELTACGVRARDLGGENPYGLTPREDVVARLVASGKSNREVADELYLSTKAIEYHLGNVFAKVNIRSRHELAGRLAGQITDQA